MSLDRIIFRHHNLQHYEVSNDNNIPKHIDSLQRMVIKKQFTMVFFLNILLCEVITMKFKYFLVK